MKKVVQQGPESRLYQTRPIIPSRELAIILFSLTIISQLVGSLALRLY